MPYMLATSVGGRNITAATEKILMMLFLLEVDQPEHRVEQKLDLAAV